MPGALTRSALTKPTFELVCGKAWTIGHVAFTFDALVAFPLRLPTPGVLATVATSKRGEGGELGAKAFRGPLPVAPTAAEGGDGGSEKEVEVCMTGACEMKGAGDGGGVGGRGGKDRNKGDGDGPLLRTNAWTVFDSMRVSGAERWALDLSGEMPDATPYLQQVHRMVEKLPPPFMSMLHLPCISLASPSDRASQVHRMVEELVHASSTLSPDGKVAPSVSYLVLYSIIHQREYHGHMVPQPHPFACLHPNPFALCLSRGIHPSRLKAQ